MNELVKEYGGALAELAMDENLLVDLLPDIRDVEKVFSMEPAYVEFLMTPNIPMQERIDAVNQAFSAVHPYVRNFLCMMTERGYARSILPCLMEYEELYHKKMGILVANVLTAIELSDEQKLKLTKKLEAKYKKQIELSCKVDSSLVGGIQISVNGELLEDSIRGKLDRIRNTLADHGI